MLLLFTKCHLHCIIYCTAQSGSLFDCRSVQIFEKYSFVVQYDLVLIITGEEFR